MGLPCSQSCTSAAFLNVASLTLTLLHTLRQGQQMLLQGFQAHKQHQPTCPLIRILRLDRPYAYSSKNDFDVVSWWNVAGSCAWLPASLPHSQLRPPSTSRVTPSPNNQCCRNRVSYPENLFGWNWLRKILHRHSFIKFYKEKIIVGTASSPWIVYSCTTGFVKTQLSWTATTAARLATRPGGHLGNSKTELLRLQFVSTESPADWFWANLWNSHDFKLFREFCRRSSNVSQEMSELWVNRNWIRHHKVLRH